jgi:hypothetical protein
VLVGARWCSLVLVRAREPRARERSRFLTGTVKMGIIILSNVIFYIVGAGNLSNIQQTLYLDVGEPQLPINATLRK